MIPNIMTETCSALYYTLYLTNRLAASLPPSPRGEAPSLCHPYTLHTRALALTRTHAPSLRDPRTRSHAPSLSLALPLCDPRRHSLAPGRGRARVQAAAQQRKDQGRPQAMPARERPGQTGCRPMGRDARRRRAWRPRTSDRIRPDRTGSDRRARRPDRRPLWPPPSLGTRLAAPFDRPF